MPKFRWWKKIKIEILRRSADKNGIFFCGKYLRYFCNPCEVEGEEIKVKKSKELCFFLQKVQMGKTNCRIHSKITNFWSTNQPNKITNEREKWKQTKNLQSVNWIMNERGKKVRQTKNIQSVYLWFCMWKHQTSFQLIDPRLTHAQTSQQSQPFNKGNITNTHQDLIITTKLA